EAPATQVILRDSELSTPDGIALRDSVEQRIGERLGWFTDSVYRYTVLADFWIGQSGRSEDSPPFAGRLQSLQGYEREVTIVEGRLPVADSAGEPIEVAISPASALVSELEVGDAIRLRLLFDTCERVLPVDEPPPPPVPCDAGAEASYELPATVVGLIEPSDPESEFWPSGGSAYFSPFRRYQETDLVLPLFVPEETIYGRLAAGAARYRPAVTWHVFPLPELLSRTNFGRAQQDLVALADDMNLVQGFAVSPLRTTLLNFKRETSHKEAPLLILLFEISGVALFYVLLMSLVVVERQAGEIALLRGRGSSISQVVLIYLFDGLMVGVPVLLAAPLLAALVTALLGLTPSFANVNGGAMLPVRLPLEAFGLAAVGVLLALLTLAVPVFFAARREVVAQKRAEARPGASVIQRYYLDLALAAVAGLLLWELNERGSVFLSESSVGLASDPLLLASPVLIIAAAAALLMRVVPLVLKVFAWAAAAGSGVAVAVALWQVVRNPGQYTRLALLLMMAVAVGTFAASYASTTERSYRERALFESGVEWRAFSTSAGVLGTDGVKADERLDGVEGLDRWTAVGRLEASPAVVGNSTGRMQLLAIDPPAVAQMIWSRHDFASRPLPELIGLLGGQDGLGGIPLPADAEKVRMWVHSDVSRESVNVWVRVHDSERNYGLVQMGSLEGRGWRQLEGPIRSEFARGLTGDVSIVSILMTEPANRPNPVNSPVVFD
ncbi:MAG: FtsX-like permease family protein, partial [Dehalococcoidia bacterium]